MFQRVNNTVKQWGPVDIGSCCLSITCLYKCVSVRGGVRHVCVDGCSRENRCCCKTVGLALGRRRGGNGGSWRVSGQGSTAVGSMEVH